jgi:class 3 adenylate cyclase
MDEDLTFGQWLRRSRKARDLTQTDLAEQVSCALGTIRKLEADELRPSKELAARLVAHFGVPEGERAAFVAYARGQADTPLPLARENTTGAAAFIVLPRGTVTFLFTDIEGSTWLWEQHPQLMPDALARHDAILHQAIIEQAGVVYKVIGDAFQAAFATAPAACAAALAAQRALAREAWGLVGALPVRMALHTCAAEPTEGDYRTGALNRLGRLLGACHGGQILLSHSTADLTRETLPPDVTLRDLGEHRLRDLSPEAVFQLLCRISRATFRHSKRLTARGTTCRCSRPRSSAVSARSRLCGSNSCDPTFAC